jgi:hypothetical protein
MCQRTGKFLHKLNYFQKFFYKFCFSLKKVLESRQFDLLLGHIQSDGVRTPGLIDKFNGQGFDASFIIEMVANDSEEKGMFEDSVKLHDLAGNHEKVVELLNKLLAQVNNKVHIILKL